MLLNLWIKISLWVCDAFVLFEFFYFCLGVFQGRLDFGCPRGILDSGLTTFLGFVLGLGSALAIGSAFGCILGLEVLLSGESGPSTTIGLGLGSALALGSAFVCILGLEVLLPGESESSTAVVYTLTMFLSLLRTHKLKQNTADCARVYGVIDTNTWSIIDVATSSTTVLWNISILINKPFDTNHMIFV